MKQEQQKGSKQMAVKKKKQELRIRRSKCLIHALGAELLLEVGHSLTFQADQHGSHNPQGKANEHLSNSTPTHCRKS